MHLDIKGGNFILQDKPKIIDNKTIHFCFTDFGHSFQYKNENGKVILRLKPKRCRNYYSAL